MEYLKLGEIFKINVNNKTVYLKVEPDGSQTGCENCYFYENTNPCNNTTNCSYLDREDDTNVIYKQINPIQDIYVVFGEKKNGFIKHVKQCGAYPNEKDAKKKVEELNRYYFDYNHYYRTVQYYPYGIITDIKEIEIN